MEIKKEISLRKKISTDEERPQWLELVKSNLDAQKKQAKIRELTTFPATGSFFVNDIPVTPWEAAQLTYPNFFVGTNIDRDETVAALTQDTVKQYFQTPTPLAVAQDVVQLLRVAKIAGYPLTQKATAIYRDAYNRYAKEHPELLKYFTTFNSSLLPNYNKDYEWQLKSIRDLFHSWFLASVGEA